MKKDSVSIIIPAFNEEKDIKETISVVSRVAVSCISDFEIIIVDDGSTDETGKIIEDIARQNRRVKIVTHQKNRGFGEAQRSGIKAATKKYITGFPADSDQTTKVLKDLILQRKKADLVSSYMTNYFDRPLRRRFISRIYTAIINNVFGLNMRYYNGYYICPSNLLKQLKLKSSGFSIFAEVKVKLLKRGCSCLEIPYLHKPRLHGVSKSLGLKSIFQTFYIFPILVRDIYFGE